MKLPPIREVSPAWADLVRKVATHEQLIGFIRAVAAGDCSQAELERRALELITTYDKGAT